MRLFVETHTLCKCLCAIAIYR